MRKSSQLIILLALITAIMVWPMLGFAETGKVVEIDVTARQFEFSPGKIVVQQGDRVRINLNAEDVTHGWYLDGYDVNVEDEPRDQEINSIEFIADQAGRFSFRCSATCGPFHPFMMGTMIVEPRSTLPMALVLTIVVALLSLVYVTYRGRQVAPEVAAAIEVNSVSLTEKWPWLKTLLRQRWLQYVLFTVNTFFFAIILFAGYAGTGVGNANFSIIFVWIVWWALLILLLIPLGGRIWCFMCPLPAPGEWLDRRTFIGKGRERDRNLVTRGWPKQFNNIWLQNFSFLVVALFSGIILTRPLATAIVLTAFIVFAIVFSLKYGKRVFCRYLCPVGGFIGLYSLVAPLELRIKDKETCRKHKEKDCICGNENGYGCPWMEVPWNMERNAYCGLCTECLKTCPKDNISVNWKPFGTDLLVAKGKGIDESYKAIIMLTCAIFYSIVFQGPWGFVKDWANLQMPGFFGYVGIFLATNLLVVPFLFAFAIWLGKGMAESKMPSAGFLASPISNLVEIVKKLLGKEAPTAVETAAAEEGKLPGMKKMFVDLSYVLVPMGLAGWAAFCLSFLFINGAYILNVLSDPFGWGWNIFGTATIEWKPVFTGVFPYLQIIILLVGLAYSISLGFKLVRQYRVEASVAWKALLPVAVFLTLLTTIFMWLYV